MVKRSHYKMHLLAKLFATLLVCHLVEGNSSMVSERRFASKKGQVLEGHVISTHHVTCPIDCTFFCSANPQCKSYNYKPRGSGDDKDICQLNDATRLTRRTSYKQDSRFLYYHDESEEYTSCLDYRRAGVNENGIYTINIVSDSSWKVYCDFTSEPRSAWTLILSVAYKNKHLEKLCSVPLYTHATVHQFEPYWKKYRLSLKHMQSLSDRSTHVRITTCFESCGVDFKDYLRAKIQDLNILTFEGRGICKNVEYINIRGNIGKEVTVPFWQHDTSILHTDSSRKSCDFDGTSDSVYSENNFGGYCGEVNPKFRGSMNENSTTEIWFGGYL